MRANIREVEDIKTMISQFIGNHLPAYMLHTAIGNFLKFLIRAEDRGSI